jgi:hypothetical protein
MAALLTDIQMSPTLTTCRVLHNTSPIVLVDSSGHLFVRLAEPTMAEPGEKFVFLRKKKNGAVFSKVETAPENSPAPITNPRVVFCRQDQCSLTNSYVDNNSSLVSE